MPSRGYTPRTIRGLGSFVLLKVPAGSLGSDAPENTWEWLPIAQVTDAIEIRMMTSEIDVSSPWNSWSVFTLGRKNVESLIIPVLYNPSLMAHSFVHSNGAPRKFLDRTFETWRVWTKSNDLEGSVCMEFSAAVSAMAIMIPHQDLQKSTFRFRVSGPVIFPSHSNLDAIIGTLGKNLVTGE